MHSRKKSSEYMQQIYSRKPMPDIEITLWHGFSLVNLMHIFRTPFPKNTSGGLLLRLSTVQITRSRSSRPEVFCKKVFLKISQNSQENTCARVSFFNKETLEQMFSCEFCDIFKSIYFYRTPLVAAYESGLKPLTISTIKLNRACLGGT